MVAYWPVCEGSVSVHYKSENPRFKEYHLGKVNASEIFWTTKTVCMDKSIKNIKYKYMAVHNIYNWCNPLFLSK